MKQVLEVERREPVQRLKPAKPMVFLDTGVIADYLEGRTAARQLFAAEARGRVRFAVNGIVCQELLLTRAAAHPKFDGIMDRLQVLPSDVEKAVGLIARSEKRGTRLLHSNDYLILSSAEACDFLVTKDERLIGLPNQKRPRIVTPQELVTLLRTT